MEKWDELGEFWEKVSEEELKNSTMSLIGNYTIDDIIKFCKTNRELTQRRSIK